MRSVLTKLTIVILINLGLLFIQREVFQFQPFLLLVTIPAQIFATIYFPFFKI